MTLSDRQTEILIKIVKDYIDTADPVSSDFLKNKYELDLSSATIRMEMQKLADMGYISQPHTSAGRIPTDKGYRFFVDFLTQKQLEKIISRKVIDEIRRINKEIEDYLIFLQEFNKLLASVSSGLAISYLEKNKVFLKEGWENVFQGPEFSDSSMIKDFCRTVSYFEKNIENFDLGELPFQIFIGEELPLLKSSNFSIIISRYRFHNDQDGLLAIVGPKRMDYDKNILLVNSIIKMLEENNL